jgi:hypothetical protein
MTASVRRIALVLLAGCCLAAGPAVLGQDFKVVWTPLGEVASAGQDTVPIQGDSKVVRVEVQPEILTVTPGKQVCISTLQVRAFGADGRALAGARLTVAIRHDHKAQLQVTHPKGDICMRPAQPGEYPVRVTSKLPAPDATRRGAQFFLRVS